MSYHYVKPKPIKANKYPGPCTECAQTVGAGEGQLIRTQATVSGWAVRHRPARTISPTGPWDKWEAYTVDGCPPWKAEA